MSDVHPADKAFEKGLVSTDFIGVRRLAFREGWDAARAWRPISEAPKDGTWILGWDDDDELPVAVQWGATMLEDEKGRQLGTSHGWFDVWGNRVSTTRFQPLPEAPGK